jgi:hypothetical protein
MTVVLHHPEQAAASDEFRSLRRLARVRRAAEFSVPGRRIDFALLHCPEQAERSSSSRRRWPFAFSPSSPFFALVFVARVLPSVARIWSASSSAECAWSVDLSLIYQAARRRSWFNFTRPRSMEANVQHTPSERTPPPASHRTFPPPKCAPSMESESAG